MIIPRVEASRSPAARSTGVKRTRSGEPIVAPERSPSPVDRVDHPAEAAAEPNYLSALPPELRGKIASKLILRDQAALRIASRTIIDEHTAPYLDPLARAVHRLSTGLIHPDPARRVNAEEVLKAKHLSKYLRENELNRKRALSIMLLFTSPKFFAFACANVPRNSHYANLLLRHAFLPRPAGSGLRMLSGFSPDATWAARHHRMQGFERAGASIPPAPQGFTLAPKSVLDRNFIISAMSKDIARDFTKKDWTNADPSEFLAMGVHHPDLLMETGKNFSLFHAYRRGAVRDIVRACLPYAAQSSPHNASVFRQILRESDLGASGVFNELFETAKAIAQDPSGGAALHYLAEHAQHDDQRVQVFEEAIRQRAHTAMVTALCGTVNDDIRSRMFERLEAHPPTTADRSIFNLAKAAKRPRDMAVTWNLAVHGYRGADQALKFLLLERLSQQHRLQIVADPNVPMKALVAFARHGNERETPYVVAALQARRNLTSDNLMSLSLTNNPAVRSELLRKIREANANTNKMQMNAPFRKLLASSTDPTEQRTIVSMLRPESRTVQADAALAQARYRDPAAQAALGVFAMTEIQRMRAAARR